MAAATSQPVIKLADGTPVPAIAFGTGTAWYDSAGNDPARPRNEELISSIKSALEAGYRHLDAAELYGTELEVGMAVKESKVPRSELWVTTKVYPAIANPAKALHASLQRLQLDYVDLYLIHAPFFDTKSHGIELQDAWEQVETLHDQGLAKHIGVSNFRISDLEKLLSFARLKPEVNQVEFNPYLQQPELAEFCKRHGIVIEAYAPLTPIVGKKGGPVDPVLEELAKKYEKTPGQVLLKWTVQEGVIAVTTSGKPSRQREQLDLDNFSLTDEERKRIRDEGSKLKYRKFWAKLFGEE